VLQVWGEQVRQKMVLGSGKKLVVSPVLYQWHTTTPFSSPDTTRFLSTGDQCTADTELCVWEQNFRDILVILYNTICFNRQALVESFYDRQTAVFSLQKAPAYCENASFLLSWHRTGNSTLTWWAASSLIRALLSESQKRMLPSVEELTQMLLCPACWQNEKPDTKSLWPMSSPENIVSGDQDFMCVSLMK